MSEERKLILQMLSEGKISADEADTLLQTIEESERIAQETVVETAHRREGLGGGLADLGRVIESAVNEATRALDHSLRSLEGRLDDRLNREELKDRVEERIRRSTERALERVMQAEQRAAQAAERAAERLQHHAERTAQREAERLERQARRDEERRQRDQERMHRDQERAAPDPPHVKRPIVKMGVQIDRVTVDQTSLLRMPGQAGDRLVLDNRVGDVTVEFYEGDDIEISVRKTVWGSDEADANERAAKTEIALVRTGGTVEVEVVRPSYAVVGMVQLKDTRLDFQIKAPRGTQLEVNAKVGNIRVIGDHAIASWNLSTKVGDVDLTVPEGASFTYQLQARVGETTVHLPQAVNVEGEPARSGSVGQGGGAIAVMVATGDIRLHH